ncbi:hypothetical protein VC83_00846 [Pseudogymnoascus destructans]|uniref:Uncharacterized protein n=2 Tax=Pseudogymnoascus destructans TaxID=655981 RepID=L8FL39_PSED2|nr:uncharacterized protein VC83_00846 [Pseudogymnoascus destructans]ELR01627.1 hypothetical protein GMDG_00003 [Pseudogymnoascus destructans 20631-21]OAF62435.1 hypothetical protein VC83_00846 [Pseudogymnoascus destructans]
MREVGGMEGGIQVGIGRDTINETRLIDLRIALGERGEEEGGEGDTEGVIQHPSRLPTRPRPNLQPEPPRTYRSPPPSSLHPDRRAVRACAKQGKPVVRSGAELHSAPRGPSRSESCAGVLHA